MDIEEKDVQKVAELFRNMGAKENQAEVMAKQLLRRAAQLAEERKISLFESTETLLKRVVQAQQGLLPDSGSDFNL